MTTTRKQLVLIRIASDITGIPRRTIQYWAQLGAITAYKTPGGGRIYVDLEELHPQPKTTDK